jgi:hypothetical protein
MDTRELTQALHDATEDVEPRPNFAADVLRGGRRRRSRNRFTIGAALAGTTAVAVAAVAVLPNHLASPPPPADQNTRTDTGLHVSLLNSSSGELINDEAVTSAAVRGWQDGIAGSAGETAGISPEDLLGEPNVYWAGTTPWGGDDSPETSTTVAIVAQETTIPTDGADIVAGLLVNNPDDDRENELELVSVQEGGWAYFMLPDLRTVIGAMPTDLPDDVTLSISTEITVDENGKSVREWHDMPDEQNDGVALAHVPSGTNVHNVLMQMNPIPEGYGSGLAPLVPLVLPPNSGEIQERGLPWPAESLHVPEPRDLGSTPEEIFRRSLVDSSRDIDSDGLLDPPSLLFDGQDPPHWTVAADLPDGRTLILSEYQELDHPAYVFTVLMRPDGSIETVTRVKEIDPTSTEPVIAPAPDGQGWVVAAWGQQISYRTSAEGSWTDLGTSAALVPADGVEIKVTDTVYPLH